ncbi:hypothetical protein [Paucisalibacillus globulus]|uniref:hypothetical protein n=1 Tax=Paucisalibacillus globulus TaxID=351095 RepID=UPI00040A926E|nr:hypothetical protein [Paucisalibacillus globulus]
MSDKKYDLLNAFPTELEDDVFTVLNKIIKTSDLDFSNCFEVDLCKSKMMIPERIYYDEPSILEFNSLTERQKVILSCLFTRHHNGFIREDNLKKIVHQSNDYN